MATAQSALEVAPSKGTGLFTAAVARRPPGRRLRGRDAATSARLCDYGCTSPRTFNVLEESNGAMHPQRKAVLLRHFGADYNGEERCSARGGDFLYFF